MNMDLVDFFLESKTVHLSMKEVKTWLDQYWERYKFYRDHWSCRFCPTDLTLPCLCDKPDPEYLFIWIYELLYDIQRFHKHERYFEKEMLEYDQIMYSEVDLKIWTYRNENLGLNTFDSFNHDYLDYDFHDAEKANLRVFGPNKLMLDTIVNIMREQLGRTGDRVVEHEIYIKREDFRNTVRFVQVFNELFFRRKILPERLEEYYNILMSDEE
ncbi:hypothetical protein NLM59_06755 [Weeksellaceae bacterium KMM 9724]|uniref:hypothetical protein n=1 Tax=Profundicola chukchiensis TaxID=2961959 RepID=UPI0024386A5B|nr:hypothetical protein [Profundicola chukchiensis]MDG4950618.1 hypothetical protein [Profundicola chukchiensis]